VNGGGGGGGLLGRRSRVLRRDRARFRQRGHVREVVTGCGERGGGGGFIGGFGLDEGLGLQRSGRIQRRQREACPRRTPRREVADDRRAPPISGRNGGAPYHFGRG
jgi:hypothetical protein